MKSIVKQLWLALAVAVSWVGVAVAADIHYVADNGGGEYNGAGYGISISVSAPASGAVVKYAESETGPWQDEPIAYRDVCDAKQIWFQISAEGYTTVTSSRTVTITPKTLTSDFVWLVLPTEDYVYDGTAKIPEAACGDGDPSIITPNDFEIACADNVNAGTAKATFTGKGNYTGTVEEEFEIRKATPNGGEEPGGGAVPPGGLSKFDVLEEYDGAEHTADAAAILAAWQDKYPDVTVEYALSGDAADWTAAPAAFVNVCETSIWYKVSLAKDECTIEMYVHRRVVPQTGNEGAAKVGDFMGYVSWTSGGENFSIPVVAGGSPLHAPLQRLKPLSAPLSTRRLNASLAVGVPLAEDSSPYCRLAAFSVSGEDISGVVEVGTEKDGRESRGALGANAKVALLGSATPDGSFAEVASVAVGADGSFSVKRPKDAAFFKLRIEVIDIVK